MGLLDGVIGGIVGAGMAGVVDRLLQQNGGVQGIVNQFEQKGFGPTVRSWVGSGANQPISAAQLQQVLGTPALHELAQKTGLSVPEVAAKLAELLPQAVDRLTPNGVVPQA